MKFIYLCVNISLYECPHRLLYDRTYILKIQLIPNNIPSKFPGYNRISFSYFMSGTMQSAIVQLENDRLCRNITAFKLLSF